MVVFLRGAFQQMCCCTLQEEEEKPAAKKQKGNDGAAVPPTPAAGAEGSRTIFMKNLAWKADEDSIREFFSECGEIASVRIGEFGTEFCQPSQCLAHAPPSLTVQTGTLLPSTYLFWRRGRLLRVHKNVLPAACSALPAQSVEICALGWESSHTLAASSSVAATDRDTGRSKGFAHIDFETPEGAAKATELSGEYLLDRDVYIELATERQPRECPPGSRLSWLTGTQFGILVHCDVPNSKCTCDGGESSIDSGLAAVHELHRGRGWGVQRLEGKGEWDAMK